MIYRRTCFVTQKQNTELSFTICEKQIWHIFEIYQNTENTAKIQNIKLVICQSKRKSISKATQHNATFKI